MVIMAVKNLLLQFRQLPRLWKVNKYDFTVWVATVASGVFIDFEYALYCGVGLSIFLVVFQSQRGKKVLFGKLKNEDLYTEESKFTVLPPYVKVFKMEASLYFATAESFRETLFKLTWDPREINKDSNEVTLTVESLPSNTGGKAPPDDTANNETKIVIIDCSSFNYVDTNGISTLSLVVKEFRSVGVIVFLVRCTSSFLAVMVRSDLMETVGEGNIYPDIVDAVSLNIMDTQL